MIGAATLGVALTPSYATVGVAAPIVVIVCRLVQGFALGGELAQAPRFWPKRGHLQQEVCISRCNMSALSWRSSWRERWVPVSRPC